MRDLLDRIIYYCTFSRRLAPRWNPLMATQWRGIIWHQLLILLFAHIFYHYRPFPGVNTVLMFAWFTSIVTVLIFVIDLVFDFAVREHAVHTTNRTWKQITEQHTFKRRIDLIIDAVLSGSRGRPINLPAAGNANANVGNNKQRQQPPPPPVRERERDRDRGDAIPPPPAVATRGNNAARRDEAVANPVRSPVTRLVVDEPPIRLNQAANPAREPPPRTIPDEGDR